MDISTIATGVPVFENREGSFEFFLDNDYYQHNQIYDMVEAYLHGKKYASHSRRRPRVLLMRDDLLYLVG